MYGKLKSIIVGVCVLVLSGCLATTDTTQTEPVAQNVAKVEPLVFELTPDLLEANIRRLLVQHSQYQQIYWHVSKRHKVVAAATVKADNLYQLVDKIIAPYKQPSQMRATFYLANKVVTFDYDKAMDAHYE